MKLLPATRRRVERLVTAPGEELGRWTRFVRFQIELWRTCAKRLHDNNVMAMSSALSYRTLLALVPTLVLALVIVETAGGLDSRKQQLRSFLENTGVTEIVIPGDQLAGGTEEVRASEFIEDFVTNVEKQLDLGKLGPVGVVLLIWTSLTLLTTMERSLNRIFGARQPRGLWRRTLVYWSVITLGPLLLLVASYLGQQAGQRFQDLPLLSWVVAVLGWIGPVLVAVLVLSCLYKLMPNTTVRLEAALGGAIIAMPLWLLAKWGLTLYVSNVATGHLYGAMGLLPIFLIWLSASWWIFLFGAQLAYTATNLQQFHLADLAETITLGPLDLLATALAVARPFARGDGAVGMDTLGPQLGLPDRSISDALGRLETQGVVLSIPGESPRYTLARPPQHIALFDLFELTRNCQDGRVARPSPEITAALETVSRRAAEERCTLADLMGSDDDSASGSQVDFKMPEAWPQSG